MDRLTHRTYHLSRRRVLLSGAALATLGLAVGCSRLAPTHPQPVKIHRVGFLADFPDTYLPYFLEGLGERGYVEGESIIVEKRYARGDSDQFPTLIAELDGLGVEAVVCGGIAACIGAKRSRYIHTPDFVACRPGCSRGRVSSKHRPAQREHDGSRWRPRVRDSFEVA